MNYADTAKVASRETVSSVIIQNDRMLETLLDKLMVIQSNLTMVSRPPVDSGPIKAPNAPLQSLLDVANKSSASLRKCVSIVETLQVETQI